MIRLEVIGHALQVERRLGALLPGQLGEGLEPSAHDVRFRRLRVQVLQTLHLAEHRLPVLLGDHRFELAAQRLQRIFVVLVELTELLLDGLELLAEQLLLLVLRELFADLRVDSALQLGARARLVDELGDAPEPRGHRALTEQLDLRRGRDLEPAADQIGDPAGARARQRGEQRLVDTELLQPADEGLGEGLGFFALAVRVRCRLAAGPPEGRVSGELGELHPLDAFDHEDLTTATAVDLVLHPSEDRHRMEVGEHRVQHLRVVLHGEEDLLVAVERTCEGSGLLPAHRKGCEATRQDHAASQRKERPVGAAGGGVGHWVLSWVCGRPRQGPLSPAIAA